MDREWSIKVLKKLLDNLDIPKFKPGSRDPTYTLILTILSHQTYYKNMFKAAERLRQRSLLNLKKIAEADLKILEEAIKPAGLYRIRALKLKQLAIEILKKYNGDLKRVLSKPLKEARKELMSLPGVGPKTADILLLFSAGKPVFPVDTHIMRIARERWRIVGHNANYDEVSKKLSSIFPPEKYLEAHFALIALGRKYCKAREPLCNQCIINELCPYFEI